MLSFQSGFFCNDLSIRYPYLENTISVPMLLVYMLLLPMLFISVVEIMRLCHNFRMRCYLRNVASSLGYFSFGFITTYFTTVLCKNVIRRLRPHFYAACQPKLNDGSSCEDDKNRMLFLRQFHCSNTGLSAMQLNELFVSFPSAHSSLSFFSMLFLVFYLQAIWRSGGSIQRALRPMLQYLFFSLALFISLSRVTDFWHHPSDVFAGAVIGVIHATLTALYVARFFQIISNTNKIGSFLPQRSATEGVIVTHRLKSNLKKSSLEHTPSSVSFNHTLQQLQLQREDPTAASNTALSSSSLQTTLAAAKEHLITSNECVWK